MSNDKIITPRKGKLIIIEGVDGVGKTTCAAMLTATLKTCRYFTTYVANPSKTGVQEELRSLFLKGGFTNPVTDYYLSLAIFAETQQKVTELLKYNQFVIVDRWLLSAYVYQILAKGYKPQMITPFQRMEDFVKPDLCIFLKDSKDNIRKRIELRGDPSDRFEDAFETSYGLYNRAIKEGSFPEYKEVVVGNRSPDLIVEQIFNLIKNPYQ